MNHVREGKTKVRRANGPLKPGRRPKQDLRQTEELQEIPGVGKSIAKDLADLGFEKIADLKNQNPQALYDALCKLRGGHIDRCVLYVFRGAVYYATKQMHDPELLKWWNWKDKNKKRKERM